MLAWSPHCDAMVPWIGRSVRAGALQWESCSASGEGSAIIHFRKKYLVSPECEMSLWVGVGWGFDLRSARVDWSLGWE